MKVYLIDKISNGCIVNHKNIKLNLLHLPIPQKLFYSFITKIQVWENTHYDT